MANSERKSYRGLALRACSRVLVFSGRSNRAELAGFLIYATALDAVLNLAFRLAFAGETEGWARLAADTVSFLPVFALLTRRLHDLNRRGWWCLFPIIIATRTEGLRATALAGYPDVRDWIESTFEPLNWVLVPGFLVVVFAAAFVQGTKESNRFGPAPTDDRHPSPETEMAGADMSAPAV